MKRTLSLSLGLLVACADPVALPGAGADVGGDGGADSGGDGGGDTADQPDSGQPDPAPTGQVLINEIMASNDGALTLDDGSTPDWIELYNPGPGAVSLDGWAISDDADEPDKATLGDLRLAPGAFLVLYASGDDASVVHLPFQLDGDGESVVLTDATGALVDAVDFPEQHQDVSWGRPQDSVQQELVGPGSLGRLSLAEEAGWAELEHDDASWADVVLPFGYDSLDGAEPTPELALFAETAQSSDGYGRTGAQAVDGEWSTFSHTNDADLEPWVQVDLGQDSLISTVTVLNRLECCPERLYNITVDILDASETPVWTSDVFNPVAEGASPADPGDTIDAGLESTVLGRYVRVSKVAVNGAGSSEWLSVAELQVAGVAAAPYQGWIETETDPLDAAWVRVPVTPDFTPNALQLDVLADDGFTAWLGDGVVASENADGADIVELTEAVRFDLDPAALDPAGDVLAVALVNADDEDALLGLTLTATAIDTLVDERVWFDEPTPGAVNGLGMRGFLARPGVDPERGFYDASFSASVVGDVDGGTLIYTTDGSAPSLFHGTAVTAESDAVVPRFDLDVDTTTVLRVMAVADDWADSPVATHTYVFLDDVIRQSAAPDGYPTTWDGLSQGAVAANYEMDPEVVDDPSTADDLMAGLRAIPTLSISTDPDGLFGATDGIYVNSLQRGDAWERAISVELILPDGSTGFQEDCGVRVHGYGWRYHSNTLKHSLRLEFRSKYGPGKLDYPLFPDAPVDRFDSIVLRSQGSRGWQDFRDPEQAQYIRDAFARDTAFAMGKEDGHAAYVHLYLNGLYWGLYMAVERPDADFGAERFGGDASEYDAINRRTSTNEAIDGDLDAYNALLALADADLSVSANYDAVAAMVDVDDLIDYMLIHQYTVNRDGPEVYSHNNMRGMRRRVDGEKFRFFVWDMEYSIWNATDNYNIDVDVSGSASHVYAKLRENADFRARYAERAEMHLTNGGALSADAALARWQVRASEIEDAVIAESARWGDTDRAVPYTRDVEWAAERARLVDEFFPQRTDVMIEQLRQADLYAP